MGTSDARNFSLEMSKLHLGVQRTRLSLEMEVVDELGFKIKGRGKYLEIIFTKKASLILLKQGFLPNAEIL